MASHLMGSSTDGATNSSQSSHCAARSLFLASLTYLLDITHYAISVVAATAIKARFFVASQVTKAARFSRASLSSVDTSTATAANTPYHTSTTTIPAINVQRLSTTSSHEQTNVVQRSNSPTTVTNESVAAALRRSSQLLALAPASERPLARPFPSLPADCRYRTGVSPIFFDMNFTTVDKRNVTRTASKIGELPDRIRAHNKKYKAMTDILETWLIDNVDLYPYPDGNSIIVRWIEDDGTSGWQIEPPIENFLDIAKHLAGRIRFPPGVFIFMRDLIATRDLVSKWYTNVQEAEPLLPIDCAVRRNTDTHVHFTDMLRRLDTILQNAQV
ncbi:hypothetical protein LTR56_004048 [Elasticomyces elasticus]|nr:hypothetical protein LTR56_004048 [Elasticomyces elasticus]KAK3661390.1 hypothetical protein LTR22_007597 [Elasticomyces elasticus]KAK4928914.1 hypothetical protein LTR49_004415 [Elasticomyces elasticus]KAK5765420.1 hypothetical protein LTS12_004433 [Elasticomyces elasticus]